ncbi:uncharacterized protein LOC143039342 [Oratosquilla oratoria]|uniref:uncharacterized protein LOC143039342 n=1 Tax=Oratosquilla oratoria TaxID=337810 RepID=UPI003F773DC0
MANPRLLRLKERTLHFKFRVKYLPGKRNSVADCLSPYPALWAEPSRTDIDLDEDLAATVAATVSATITQEGFVVDEECAREAAAADPVYQMLLAKVTAGDWHPNKSQEAASLRPFYGVRVRLALATDVVTYTFDQEFIRLVIPEALRQRVAANLHAGHQGVDSMLRRAKQAVYWPGIEDDLQHHRRSCEE